MRNLPPTKLVKTKDHVSGFSSYDIVTLFDEMKLGEIFKLSDAPSWTCATVTTHPQYGEGIKVVGYRRTRSEASERVVEAWLAPIDEVEAYAMQEAVQAGVRQAEESAARQLRDNSTGRLIPAAYGERRPFSVSTRRVADELVVHRSDLANRLAGLKPAESYYLRHNAYMIRMSELELDRREKDARYDAVVALGDYIEEDVATYNRTWVWWDKRIAEIAEQLGQAQAHAIRRPNIQFKSRDDGELMEETVFAGRSLKRQRTRDHIDVDALRTAAFAYQLCLNASHERALAHQQKCAE